MKRIVTMTLLILIFCVVASCGRNGRPRYDEDEQARFVGVWKFISILTESSDGELFFPYGENLFGKLVYTPEGHMSFLAMRPDRLKFESGDIYNGTPEEIRFAFENFDAYCGTYTVDIQGKTVTHVIEGSRFPNWEGSEQIRHYSFKEDTLMLSATLCLQGKEWTARASMVKL